MISRIRAFLSLLFLLSLLILLADRVRYGHKHLTTSASGLQAALKVRALSRNHQFFPASHKNIHCVGRWIPTSNRLRWDGAFSGAYIDLVVRNATSLLISLHNAPSEPHPDEFHEPPESRQMIFKPIDHRSQPAAPVTLSVLIGNEKLLRFPRSGHSLLVLNLTTDDNTGDSAVRITYEVSEEEREEQGIVQFKGIWLPKGGSLQPRVAGIRANLIPTLGSTSDFSEPISCRKTLEVVTDSSAALASIDAVSDFNWTPQLATLFDVDHVTIPVQKYCLSKACTHDKQSDLTTHDVFFRTGPPPSAFFKRPWQFHHYVPDVLVLDLGTADYRSFLSSARTEGLEQLGTRSYHQTLESFSVAFIAAYVALIQQIRRTAYPLHPAARHDYSFTSDGYTYNSAPSTIPIFVLRPLDGSLEHATLTVVEQLQEEGDKSVFWIDTSGWLNGSDFQAANSIRGLPALTPGAHVKVATFMHAHLCHYLARDPEACSFLRHDNYLGSVYIPQEAELDKMIEERKVKILTDLFWGRE